LTYQPQPGTIQQINNRDTTWNSVHIRIRNFEQTYARTMELRGIPDNWMEYGANSLPVLSGTLTRLLGAWTDVVAAPNLRLAWHALRKSSAGVNTPVIVTSVSAPLAGRVIYTTATPHGLIPTDYCTIAGIRGQNLSLIPPWKTTINGIRQVTTAPTPTTFTCEVMQTQLPGPPVLQSVGTVRARLDTYPQVWFYSFMSLARRQTGRPFFLPLGHRRKRAYG
jgi:hypothetical protein